MNLVAGGNRDAGADQSASIGVASTVKIGPDGRFVTTRFAHYHVGSEVPPVDDAAIGFGDAKPDPAPGQVHEYVGHEVFATSDQIGAAWGVAAAAGNPGAPVAEARGARTFYGAYLKADTRFGPGGPGAVYVRSASGAVSEFVRIPDAGGTAGQLGGLHAPAWPDPQADVGKRGLGDVEIDTNERFLYVVN